MRLNQKRLRQLEVMLFDAARRVDESASARARPFAKGLCSKEITVEAPKAIRERTHGRMLKPGEKMPPPPIVIPARVSCVLRDGDGLRLGRSTMLDQEDDGRPVVAADSAPVFVFAPERRTFDILDAILEVGVGRESSPRNNQIRKEAEELSNQLRNQLLR